MELPLLIKALILGIIEGLTEFLPVSSTGHLIIVGDLLDFNDDKGKVFEIVIQLGAILGVVWDYRARVGRLITGLNTKHEQRFLLTLFIAFLPAAVAGLLLHQQIKTYLFNPITVAWALIVGGFVILWIERLPLRVRVTSMENLGPVETLKIGIAQHFSLFPETGLVIMPLLPGDSLLFVTGTLAAAGGMDVTWIIVILISAAICGDNTNYWIGHHLGPKVFRRPDARFLNPRHP